MAPSNTTPASAGATANASASRSRPQAARKKANVPADDAAYHASAAASGGGAGTKRTAVERAEGEPRVKRKRVDASGAGNGIGNNANVGTNASASAGAARRERLGTDVERKSSLIDFSTLPIEAVHEYLVQYDLVPDIDPSPLTAEDPPPPTSLLRPRSHARRHASTASPAPSLPITPANRPRREVPSRRRSARLIEDDRGSELSITPILADVDEVHGMLATVAQRHFREQVVKEVDTLASFMCAVKAKARTTA